MKKQRVPLSSWQVSELLRTTRIREGGGVPVTRSCWCSDIRAGASITTKCPPCMAERIQQLEAALKVLLCDHLNRTGGNGYIICPDCHLGFDYRKETIRQAELREAQAALAAPPIPRTGA